MLMPAERIAAFARAKAASLRLLAKHGDVDFIQDPETGRFQGSRPHGHGDDAAKPSVGSGSESSKGDCFKAAYQWIKKNPDATLVQALVSADGKRFPHAWGEDAKGVHEVSNGQNLTVDKDDYYATFNVDPSDPNEYRRYSHDEALIRSVKTGHYGPWDIPAETKEDTSVGFVSPNIGNLNFDEALAGLESKRQDVLRRASRSIDDALGKKPIEAASVVGAWADGAENSLMLTMPVDWTREQARVALAMKGWIGDQKSVLLFTPALKGGSYLASLSLKGSLGDIHRQLLQDGLTFHTLAPTADGATVYVYGDDQGTADTIDRIAGEHDTQAHFTFGRGEFIGTKLESGSDREQRDDARREYEAVIATPEARAAFPGRDVGEAWQALRDRWGRELAEVKSALAAVAAAQAHQSIGIHFRWRQAKGVALLRLSNEQRHAIARRKAEQTLARLCKHTDVDFIQDPQSGRFQGSRPHGHADEKPSEKPPLPEPVERPALNGSNGHPDLVSTANITGTKARGAVGDSNVDYFRADTATMKLIPDVYHHNVGLLKRAGDYPMRPADVAGDSDQIARAVMDHAKTNMRWLYQTTPQAVRDGAARWYHGANRLVIEQVVKHANNTVAPITEATVAGVYARLSPQKLWDINVEMGNRVLDIYLTKQNKMWSSAMEKKAAELIEPKKDKPQNAELRALLPTIRDRKLSELTTITQKAAWVRVYDQAHNSPRYPTLAPDGTRIGMKSKLTWNTMPNIASAIAIIESRGDRNVISEALGGRHKIRAFYNNILDPDSANRDVTIDMHMVGTAWLRGFGGDDPPVLHSLQSGGTTGSHNAKGSTLNGIKGTYPIYADAVRELADEMKIAPHALQAAVWTAKLARMMNIKDAAKAKIDAVWREYQQGRIELATAHQRIDAIVPFRNPGWVNAVH